MVCWFLNRYFLNSSDNSSCCVRLFEWIHSAQSFMVLNLHPGPISPFIYKCVSVNVSILVVIWPTFSFTRPCNSLSRPFNFSFSIFGVTCSFCNSRISNYLSSFISTVSFLTFSRSLSWRQFSSTINSRSSANYPLPKSSTLFNVLAMLSIESSKPLCLFSARSVSVFSVSLKEVLKLAYYVKSR